MRPAFEAARTDPSSTQPGRCLNAYTVGSVVTLAVASRVTSARSEKTVTFLISEVSPTVPGSSGAGDTRLACGSGDPASFAFWAGFAGSQPAASAATKTKAACPIVRFVCIVILGVGGR